MVKERGRLKKRGSSSMRMKGLLNISVGDIKSHFGRLSIGLGVVGLSLALCFIFIVSVLGVSLSHFLFGLGDFFSGAGYFLRAFSDVLVGFANTLSELAYAIADLARAIADLGGKAGEALFNFFTGDWDGDGERFEWLD